MAALSPLTTLPVPFILLINYGILDAIEQTLLPGVSTNLENQLGFRRMSAELCKLNVSVPSSLPNDRQLTLIDLSSFF